MEQTQHCIGYFPHKSCLLVTEMATFRNQMQVKYKISFSGWGQDLQKGLSGKGPES